MNTLPFSSTKLEFLLTHLWSSPVFGTSYPSSLQSASASVRSIIEQVYNGTFETLVHVFSIAWPRRELAERHAIAREITAKSVAFCGAIAAGEIDDVDRLRAAATAIALVYWIDQTMDRGDEAMVAAVELIAGGYRRFPAQEREAVHDYAAGLGWFLREVTVLARPEDGLWILRCLLDETLVREARMRRLSQLYTQSHPAQYWQQYADEIAHLSVYNVGFIAVSAMVYAVHRQYRPELPSLLTVLSEPDLLDGPLRAGCAAIRVLDDIGDREIDLGSNPRWGLFTLNIWNQYDPPLLEAFLHAAGIRSTEQRSAMVAAWHARDHQILTELWLDDVRSHYQAVAPDMRTRYDVFLQLSQRVVEAGLVNALGDDVLAETLQERAVGM